MGVAYFVLYFFVFSFMIRKFDYKTPGRDDSEVKLYTRKDMNERQSGKGTAGDTEMSRQIMLGLGGKDNITDVDCCITRLRCSVKDGSKVDPELLKATGASGALCKGKGIQVVYGPKVSVIKSNLEAYLKSDQADDSVENHVPAVPIASAENKSPASSPSNEPLIVYSPLAGKVIPIAEVPDDVFSQKMVGDGFGVIPTEDDVFAPVDGVVSMIFDTKHAFTILTPNGAELLVHMGLDTIQLQGAPFTLLIKEGETVKVGQLVGKMDRAAIEEAGYQTVTPVVIGDLAGLSSKEVTKLGTVKPGDPILQVK